MHQVAREDFGKLLVLRNNNIGSIPLEEVANKFRRVTPDHYMIKTAQSLGICLGNPEEVSLEEYFEKIAAK